MAMESSPGRNQVPEWLGRAQPSADLKHPPSTILKNLLGCPLYKYSPTMTSGERPPGRCYSLYHSAYLASLQPRFTPWSLSVWFPILLPMATIEPGRAPLLLPRTHPKLLHVSESRSNTSNTIPSSERGSIHTSIPNWGLSLWGFILGLNFKPSSEWLIVDISIPLKITITLIHSVCSGLEAWKR